MSGKSAYNVTLTSVKGSKNVRTQNFAECEGGSELETAISV